MSTSCHSNALRQPIPRDDGTPSDSFASSGTAILHAPHTPKTATVEIVIPVFNEEQDLESSVRLLRAYLDTAVPWDCTITVADNASTDLTPSIAARLATEVEQVKSVRLPKKGRGRALRHTWLASTADVVVYMDVDLSTDLSALLPLIAPLVSGHSDIAIGTRLSHFSRVTRGPKREFISRCYNRIIRYSVGAHFSDAQCGFKAMRAEVAHQLLPLVKDEAWFFDTEVLILAEQAGMRIHEVPVDWTDDPNSSVDIVDTALKDIRGLWRVGTGLVAGRIPVKQLQSHDPRAVTQKLSAITDTEGTSNATSASHSRSRVWKRLFPSAGQLATFVSIGLVSTAAFAVLYLLFRPLLGPQLANLLALILTAIANTSANRRLTFNSASRATAIRDHVSGLALMLVAWALTSGSLAALGIFLPGASHTTEIVVLTIANLVATLIRFLGLKAVTSR